MRWGQKQKRRGMGSHVSINFKTLNILVLKTMSNNNKIVLFHAFVVQHIYAVYVYVYA